MPKSIKIILVFIISGLVGVLLGYQGLLGLGGLVGVVLAIVGSLLVGKNLL